MVGRIAKQKHSLAGHIEDRDCNSNGIMVTYFDCSKRL